MWKQFLCAVVAAHAVGGAWAASGKVSALSSKPEAYPTKPIRVLYGFAAGGSGDVALRVIAPKLAERLGQNIVIDNRPGAGSNIAAEMAARAAPDGYTLLLGVMSPLASSRSLYPNLGYDLLKDFSFITVMATDANVLFTHPSFAAKSVSDLLAIARAKPKSIRYASAGVASIGHLAIELLQSRTSTQLVHVPYKGASLVVVAVTGGEVPIGAGSVTAALSMINAQRVIPLAVTGARRAAALPAVPTVAESGVPDYNVTNSLGLLAPAGTPAAVIKLFQSEISRILQIEDVRVKFAQQALEPVGNTPEEFRKMTAGEVAQWARVIKDANITVN